MGAWVSCSTGAGCSVSARAWASMAGVVDGMMCGGDGGFGGGDEAFGGDG